MKKERERKRERWALRTTEIKTHIVFIFQQFPFCHSYDWTNGTKIFSFADDGG